MPLDNQHAPLDSPNLTGTPTAPTPGVGDSSTRIATTAYVKAQQKPDPGNQPITLSGDAAGTGTSAIQVEVTGIHGRPITTDPPSDTQIYVWNQGLQVWELKLAEEIGSLPGGASGQVQVNDGTGQFRGITISGDAVLNTSTGVETVTGLQGRPVASAAPADLQVLTWSQSAGRWQPGIGVGSGIGIPGGAVGTVQVNAGGGNFRGINIAGDATLNTTTGVETVTGLQGHVISTANPADGQVLTWIQSANLWTPTAPTGGVADAPSDGTAYGRRNAAWIAVAPLTSPALLGNPTAPTPTTPHLNDTSLATTAFVTTAISSLNFAPIASPIFTGDPQAPTPPTIDHDTSIATTAFVKNQNYLTGNQTITLSNDATGSGTTSIPVTLQTVNSSTSGPFAVWTANAKGLSTLGANLTGDVTSSGAATTLATVNNSAGVPGVFQGLTINAKGLVTACVNQGYAPLASPIFTGDPTAPTPSPGDADFSIATTAFVDTSFLKIATAAATYAPIASPNFSGDPRAPTPPTNDADFSIATTAFVKNQNYLTTNLTITLSGDLAGSGTTAIPGTVTGLRGRVVSATAPTDTQVLAWSTANNQWQPTAPASGSGTPAGLTTQVQYNNAGTLGGSAGATFTGASLTSLNVALGSDATGDIYYRAAGGALTRLGPGSAGTVLQITGGLPSWQAISTGGGTVNLGTGPQLAQYPSPGSSNVVGGVTISGDASIANGGALTLNTSVNPNVGTFQGITLNNKGLATAAVDLQHAPLASPIFTGDPHAPTPPTGDADFSIATTAFVANGFIPNVGGTITGTTPGTLTINRNAAALPPAVAGVSPLWTNLNASENGGLLIDAHSGVPSVVLRRANGPGTGAGQILANDILGNYSWRGYTNGASQAYTAQVGRLQLQALEPFTATAQGTQINIGTVPIGQTAVTTQLAVGPGLTVGTPTAPAGGTLFGDVNATRVFQNGAAVAGLASPIFTGDPTAPTPPPGDADFSIATTAFVATSFAPIFSPNFTGDPRAPTPPTNDADFSIATTAFVKNQNYLTGNQSIAITGDATGSGTTSIPLLLQTVNSSTGTPFAAWTVNGKGLATLGNNLAGDVTTSGFNATLATVNGFLAGQTFQGITINGKGLVTGATNQNYAPLASPIFTGDPTAPTPPDIDADTSIATTAFVKNQKYITLDAPATNLTAGTIAIPLVLNARLNEVLTVAAGGAVRLGAFMATPGERCRIIGYGANDLQVVPGAGQTFFAGGVSNGVDQPLTLNAGSVAEYQCITATTLYQVSVT